MCVRVLPACVHKCAREQIEVSHSVWRPNSNYCNTSSGRQNTNCAGSIGLSPWACHWRSRLIMFDGELLELKCTGAGRDAAPWISIRCSSRLSAATADYLSMFMFLSFTVAVSLPPSSFSSRRIKLHLLQVFHHGGKRRDISEDNAEEWVTHLFSALLASLNTLSAHFLFSLSLSFSLSLPPFFPVPSSPLHLSLLAFPLYSSVLCLSSLPRSIPLFLRPFLFSLSPFTSSPHSFRLAIVCSVSVWNLFRPRRVQVSPSCRLTSHFAGSSIMY